jgi:hypothetical protein
MSSQLEPGSASTWPERRSAPRFLASGEPARIAWKQQGLRVCKAPARLIDIATSGAGLVATRPAEPGEMLWLGVASLPWEWVKATVRAAWPDGTRWRLHVFFCEPCPMGLFEQAIGLSARRKEAPLYPILRNDDDVELHTCFTMRLF